MTLFTSITPKDPRTRCTCPPLPARRSRDEGNTDPRCPKHGAETAQTAEDAVIDPGTSSYILHADEAVERGIEVPGVLRQSWLFVQNDEVLAWAPTEGEIRNLVRSFA